LKLVGRKIHSPGGSDGYARGGKNAERWGRQGNGLQVLKRGQATPGVKIFPFFGGWLGGGGGFGLFVLGLGVCGGGGGVGGFGFCGGGGGWWGWGLVLGGGGGGGLFCVLGVVGGLLCLGFRKKKGAGARERLRRR